MKGFLRLVGTVLLLVAAAYGLRAYFRRSERTTEIAAPAEAILEPVADAGGSRRGSAPDPAGAPVRRSPPPRFPEEARPPVRPEPVGAREALARGRELMQASGDPKGRIEAWRLLTLAYEEAPDVVLRNEARDILRPFIAREVLSERLPDDPEIARVWLVKPGDTLGRIAKECGTTVEAIKRLNGLTSDLIQAGRRLKVFDRPMDVYVDKSDFRLWVLYGGRFLLECSCGLGLENKTPVAVFEIETRQIRPPWYSAQGVIYPHDPRYELGERWLGFKAGEAGTGLGIHGTAEAASLGRESSRGCIRLLDPDVILLYDLLPLGTKVRVLP